MRLTHHLTAILVLASGAHGDLESIRATVEFMASQGSRVSGYPGADRAADYVQEAFVAAGMSEVTREEYGVTVPIDRGGELTILDTGERIHLDGLWPNHVRTNKTGPDGLTGNLIYGGSGQLAELNGREVDDSIVLMEFNSGNRWVQAASLGAQAIIFIEPDATFWSEAETKFLSVPLPVPRFWIDAQTGARLRELVGDGELAARVTADMEWQLRPAYNIWGQFPGRHETLRDETIIVQAYYDGMSVVPAKAPAAEAAGSIAALLELARHLRSHPPDRTVILVATGAHFISLRGIIDFLDRHARKHEDYVTKMERPLEPDLFISLDLTSKSDQVGIWNNTLSYDVKRFYVPFGRSFTAYAREVAPRLGRDPEKALVNGISPIKGLDWTTFVPGGVSVDGSLVRRAGQIALSFVTINDGRFIFDSPLDQPHLVDYDNLARQSAFLNAILTKSFNDEKLLSGLEDFTPILKDELRTFIVNARSYPRRSQVPDKIIRDAIVSISSGGGEVHKGVRSSHFHFAGDDGSVEIPGVVLGAVGVAAYVLDPKTGDIIYAPDMGERASKVHGKKLAQAVRFGVERRTLVLFPCTARPFYQLIDPRMLKALPEIEVLDEAGVKPQEFGLARGRGVMEPVAMAFGAPDDTLMYLMGDSMILTNSRNSPRGDGYVVGEDNLERTGYLAVQDMWRLNNHRLEKMRQHAIENPRLIRLHAHGRILIDQASEAAENRQWDMYMANVRAAMGITSRAYPDVMGTLNDVIKGLVFFLALVLPAAFFGERLVFASSDIRWQLGGFALILALIWLALSLVHPAFAIAHPAVILLAFVIMVMAAFVFAMITSRFNKFMREYQARSAHIYQTDINRISASYAAFMLGISNMRRRKLRTGLTLTTLTLLTFTVLSFTSFRQQITFMAFPTDHAALYEGTQIRDRGWGKLSLPTLDFARSHFDEHGVVSPRNWYISEEAGSRAYVEIQARGRKTRAAGLVGFSPQEVEVTGMDAILTAGSFFEREDEATCLLSQRMAENLGIGPADVGTAEVRAFGKELLVRGIFDAEAYEAIHDLDDEPLTPVDFQSSTMDQMLGGPETQSSTELDDGMEQQMETRSFVHVSPEQVLIMPYGTVWAAGGTLRSIGVRFDENVEGLDLLEDFLMRLAVSLFAGIRDQQTGAVKVSSYTSFGVTAVEGLGALMVPMLIAALIVLNAMLGAVYERFREIAVYSSVGLAPMHIALLFIAEACVYAVLGVTLGYILGQGMGKILLGLDLVQGMDLNYSSMSAIVSALMVMGVVLISTIYPARIASRTAVPDTVRRWVPPSPDGDRWEFDFPFSVGIAEVVGLSGFLANYFKAYSEESIGDFYADKVRIISEEREGATEYSVQMLVWLAPFDLGVSQYMQLDFVPSEMHQIYTIEVFIERISGETASWKRVNQRFMNGLRKQFLLWHTFDAEAKAYHRGEAETMLAQSAAGELEVIDVDEAAARQWDD